jgi:hypothetical protein
MFLCPVRSPGTRANPDLCAQPAVDLHQAAVKLFPKVVLFEYHRHKMGMNSK